VDVIVLGGRKSEEVKRNVLVCAQRTSQPCRVGPSVTSGHTSRSIGAIRSNPSRATVLNYTVEARGLLSLIEE
jgi:hypothetical protein